MKYCELTLPTPEENLACDEVLLDLCEERPDAANTEGLLRFWEPAQYFVVLGYADRAATEVHLAFCRQHTIPVLRRCTGGGTVLQGPGCLNYSLFLPIAGEAALQSIRATNDFVLARHQAALSAALRAPVEKQGHTDLSIGGLKFCGNAQRRRKNFLLFHGSFLLHLDIELIEKSLPLPGRQPDYRLHRSHTDFLLNLKTPAHTIKAALLKAWEAGEPFEGIPFSRITLVAEAKYVLDEWNFKF
jgi:lipoate-protein ligase A